MASLVRLIFQQPYLKTLLKQDYIFTSFGFCLQEMTSISNWITTFATPNVVAVMEARRNPLPFMILMEGPLDFNILLMELASELLLNPMSQDNFMLKQHSLNYYDAVNVLLSVTTVLLQVLCFLLYLQLFALHFVTFAFIHLFPKIILIFFIVGIICFPT